MSVNVIALIFLLLAASPAQAYLDPGSGSLLLYALAGFGVALAYSVRSFFYRVTGFITGKGKQSVLDIGDAEIVFYSEGGQYWQLFAPVIDALAQMGVKSVYLTSDENDKGLQLESPHVIVRYIGGVNISAAVLNRLTAKLLVMTTPQLGIFNLRRSENVHHYSHLIHAPTDALMYKRYAFDHFDSVLCSGPHQMKTIRELEALRGSYKKELFETGLTYYDDMLDNLPEIAGNNHKTTVLIAPTWGAPGLLLRYGSAWIELLLNDGYNVILRPHPQSYKSEPALMDKIESELKRYENLKIDRAPSGQVAMASSDIMISDLSGIIFDFAFLFSKPVIIVDAEIERGGYEAEYLEKEIWEVSVLDKIGKLITEKDFSILSTIVDETLSSYTSTDTKKFREQAVFNFGKAGEVAAGQLIDILRRQSGSSLHAAEKRC